MPILSTQEHERNRALLEVLDSELGPSLDRREQSPADSAWKLLEGELDLALVSPLVFAQREGDLTLLHGACVAATGATGEVVLQFRQGLREINTVGFYGDAGLDAMLAEIILKEKYRVHPRFFQMTREPAEALAAVDALLYPADIALQPAEGCATMDMIDEWFDLTQLPFVREVFVAWESRMDAAVDDAIRRAGDVVDAEVLRALDEEMRGRNSSEDATASLPAHYRYRFTPDALEGMQSFFKMAFFHGLHRDIPNFTFWSPEEEEH
ncbi:MAG: MqnA/MqnD/SBP family protein [Bacteroidota bacterium]|nr:MqnA/MqnD/SBP family protein [Bacteroidota bacterium]